MLVRRKALEIFLKDGSYKFECSMWEMLGTRERNVGNDRNRGTGYVRRGKAVRYDCGMLMREGYGFGEARGTC